MVGIENPEAVHDAWHSMVNRQAAERGNPPPPPPDETAWFQSGHSRRTDGLRPPLPADAGRAASGAEGVVRQPGAAADGEGGVGPASAGPAPTAAEPPAAPTVVQRRPSAAAAAPSASPPAGAAPVRPAGPPAVQRASQAGFNTRPLPDLNTSIFGSALFDFLGPLLAVLVSVVSVYAWQHSAGIVAARRAPPPLPTRYFSPVSRVASVAQQLWGEIKGLELVCPHTHVEGSLFADSSYTFPNPAALFVTSDHYVLRMLHSQGVPLSSLGLACGNASDTPEGVSPREVWRTFAAHQDAFRATPTSLWLRESLASTFNITERLSAANADRLYDALDAALKSDQFKPVALLEAWNIRVLATTNGATDPLMPHIALSRQPAMRGRIIPTFRPDDVCDLRHKDWRQRIGALRELTGLPVLTFDDFLAALRARRAEFKRLGATASDHGVAVPVTTILAHDKVRALFAAALAGKPVSPEDGASFTAHMLVEHARMSAADGLVMQLHAGVHRNHHPRLFESCGPDIGADIPVAVDWTAGLQPLLGELGTHPNLTVVLFTLDEATYSRELAPLAGFYPVLKLGPPWWFHDSLHGMRRYLDGVVDSAGVANLAGFNDDARNFLTLQARHTVWRRAVSDWVATQHVAGVLDWADALQVAKDLAVGLAVKTYKLPPRV